jgi:hypothetical protein
MTNVDDICIPVPVAAQLTYHLKMAIAFATAERTVEAASETTLGLALLSLYCTTDGTELTAEFPDATVAQSSPERWEALCARTEALGRELQAHFVSEGQHPIATLYESAAGAVRSTIAPLRIQR